MHLLTVSGSVVKLTKGARMRVGVGGWVGSVVRCIKVSCCVDGWEGAALVSNFPQVLSHAKCFLVERSSVGTFLSHDYNQHWST